MAPKNSIRFLVVDDTSVSRSLICMSLEELGFTNVEIAKSGAEAFDFAARQGVHVVISDYNMPGMNGIQLLEKLRMHKPTSGIGFVLISGSMTRELLVAAQKFGLNNFLQKPFDTKQMKTCLEKVLGPL